MPFRHYVPQDAPITQGGAGTTEIVAAVPGHKIRVVSFVLTMSAAGTVKFQSAANDKTGAMPIALNGGLVVAGVPFMCNSGEALRIVSTGGAAAGYVNYQLIPG